MILLVTLAGTLPLGACSTEDTLLASILMPLPPSTEVKHQPRRLPYVKEKPVQGPRYEDMVEKEKIDWRAIYASLPRDDEDIVNWMQALTDKLIKPRPGIDPNAEEGDTEDAEVEFVNEKKKKTVTFRHITHTQWLTCKNCHPAIFKKKGDNLQFTHDDMDDRKYCGVCHEKVVFIPEGCKACHAKKS
jgi:c(7)-type cytochrome triheme protein